MVTSIHPPNTLHQHLLFPQNTWYLEAPNGKNSPEKCPTISWRGSQSIATISHIAGHDTQAHGMRRRQLRDGGLRGALVSVMRLSSIVDDESEVGCFSNPKMRGRDFFNMVLVFVFWEGMGRKFSEIVTFFENILLGNDISLYDEWIWVGMVGAIGAMPLGINAMGTIG